VLKHVVALNRLLSDHGCAQLQNSNRQLNDDTSTDQGSINQGCSVCAGLNIVEGGRAPLQHSGNYRKLADLQVPYYYGYHDDAPRAEVHSRELQEGGNFPAPKVPTFSVFSALYDSVLGEVCFVTSSQGTHTDTRIVLSMATAAGVVLGILMVPKVPTLVFSLFPASPALYDDVLGKVRGTGMHKEYAAI